MQNIYYQNKKNFENKLKTISLEGYDKMHVIADFDRTLTKSFVNGVKKPSIISVLRDDGYLSQEYRIKAKGLYDFYHPYEIDSKLSLSEKKKYMEEWRTKHSTLLVDSGLTKDDVKSVGRSGSIKLRDGVKDFMQKLSNKQIPLIIMSANALGKESISMYLDYEGYLFKNIYIISNSFRWNDDGSTIGFDERVIHSFNKGEQILSDFPEIHSKVSNRKNVILLGDSLGDPDMIEGFDYNTLIKVGFLNENKEELLEIYKQKYDVVLTGDSEGEFINTLITQK